MSVCSLVGYEILELSHWQTAITWMPRDPYALRLPSSTPGGSVNMLGASL